LSVTPPSRTATFSPDTGSTSSTPSSVRPGRSSRRRTFDASGASDPSGITGVTAHGTSDELGFKAAEHPAYCYDLHATALHLLGIDHEKLSVYNNGIKRRLTDVHGHVIEPIIA